MYPRLLAQICYSPADDAGTFAPQAPPADADRSFEAPVNKDGKPAVQPVTPESGDKPRSGGENAAEIRQDIRKTAKDIESATEKAEKHLPYFDQEEADADTPPANQDDSDETPVASQDEEPTPFYSPEVHAKDKPVYPNSYKSRQDAEYAIAEKIRMFGEKGDKLSEVGSEVGATVPHEVQQEIDKYKDVTHLAEADDDEIRDFIVNLDLSIKAVDEKYQKVSEGFNKTKALNETAEQLKQAESKATKVSQEIGLAQRLNELPEDASFEDLLALADEQIDSQLEPIRQQIAEHENNEKFLKEKGQAAYLSKLREMEGQLRDKENQLKQGRQSLVEWNDARVKAEAAKKTAEQAKPLSQAEQLKKMDQTYYAWADDKKVGPFALELFKAPTTDPVSHFRAFAFADANRGKFDLTTKGGWDQMHAYWRSEQQKRFNAAQKAVPPGSQGKRTSTADGEIPEPPVASQQTRVGKGPVGEMQQLREDIKRKSKGLFQ